MISRQLEKLIIERKLKDIDILKLCGFTRPTLAKLKADKNINIETIVALAKGLGVPVGYFFDEETPRTEVRTEGDYSPASYSGDVSVVEGDAILAERVRSLEALMAEKDARIAELKERIDELKHK